jgi:hypothetical protein
MFWFLKEFFIEKIFTNFILKYRGNQKKNLKDLKDMKIIYLLFLQLYHCQ